MKKGQGNPVRNVRIKTTRQLVLREKSKIYFFFAFSGFQFSPSVPSFLSTPNLPTSLTNAGTVDLATDLRFLGDLSTLTPPVAREEFLSRSDPQSNSFFAKLLAQTSVQSPARSSDDDIDDDLLPPAISTPGGSGHGYGVGSVDIDELLKQVTAPVQAPNAIANQATASVFPAATPASQTAGPSR